MPWSGGGSNGVGNFAISKLFQAIDAVGEMKINNITKVIPLALEIIKDDYYYHDAMSNPGEVTILVAGWYRVSATVTISTRSAAQGIRGNPTLNIEINNGSGWAALPDRMGGYIRENSTARLSTSITGVGLFNFNNNDKIRLTSYDTVANEPDEATEPYSSRLILEYIDRRGA